MEGDNVNELDEALAALDEKSVEWFNRFQYLLNCISRLEAKIVRIEGRIDEAIKAIEILGEYFEIELL
jgi:hypothetical protein